MSFPGWRLASIQRSERLRLRLLVGLSSAALERRARLRGLLNA
jgi:hypothetical protein